MLETTLGLSLGLDNFFFRFLPIQGLSGFRLISFLAIGYILIKFKTIRWKESPIKIISFLLIWGLALACSRYQLFYADHGYVFSPVLRQFVGFILGLLTFVMFLDVFEKNGTSTFIRSTWMTSLPFLLIGCKQFASGEKVFFFPRATSLFSEPSFYGDYLVLIVLPGLLFQLREIKNCSRYLQAYYLLIWSLVLLNLFAVQSGTAFLKVGTLIACAAVFFPMKTRYKLGLAVIVLTSMTFLMMKSQGYVNEVFKYALDVMAHPDKFFQYHTFYDRIYPMYAAIENFFTPSGWIGLGFGGDYFEFKNLYPPITHQEMLLTKPTLSFFNSFSSKVLLYFGIPSLMAFYLMAREVFKCSDVVLKITLANVLLSCFWGLANFSFPHLWIWLAMSYTIRTKKI